MKKSSLFFSFSFGGDKKRYTFATVNAGIAQLVEHQLPKLRVASSSLVSRSFLSHLMGGFFFLFSAQSIPVTPITIN